MKVSNEKLKILFVAHANNIETGSYRIWVEDYCKYFRSINVESSICLLGNMSEAQLAYHDVIILGKLSKEVYRPAFDHINKRYPQKVIGAITPPNNLKDVPFDFVMAGSLEEADSLSFHKNVIVNGHIESLYWGSQPKMHVEKDILKICVHGWTAHLASFAPNLNVALEEFEKEQAIELVIVCESANADWIIGRPNIKNITIKKWDIKTVKQDIQECDIGIVPGIHDLTSLLDHAEPQHGFFETDYIFRVKNKCNNGRSLVFFYLGIPVICDFSPSNFHILGGGDCGFVAHTRDGWLSALRKLKDRSTRELVSKKALEKANIEYNPQCWAQKYYNAIAAVYKSKLDANVIGSSAEV